jgi:hypothetical protein
MAADMFMSCLATRVFRSIPYPEDLEQHRTHRARVYALGFNFPSPIVRIECLDAKGEILCSIQGAWPDVLGHMAAKIVFVLHKGVDLEFQTQAYLDVVRRLIRESKPR